MAKVTQLESGTIIELEGKYFRVQKVTYAHIGRGKANAQLMLKNILTGQSLTRNFKSDENLMEAEVEEREVDFKYRKAPASAKATAGKNNLFFFAGSEKLELENSLGRRADFLKIGMKVKGIFIEDKLVSIELPIKETYKVTEAPPGVKGDTAAGGSKTVTIESGAQIKTPLFIKEGDLIVINTETGEYVERA